MFSGDGCRLDNRNSHCKTLKQKFFVPDCQYSIKSRLKWLAGWLDADGTITRNGTNESLQCFSTNFAFLEDIRLMLQTVGVHSKIIDDTGDCKESKQLLISSTGLWKLHLLGFKTTRLEWQASKPQPCSEQFVEVISVRESGRRDATYCFTESRKGMGVFNGLLTGQCSEIMLPSSEDYTFTCVLSSLNIARYEEWKDTSLIEDATVFLDCVASLFIEQGSEIPGLEKAVKFTEHFRALGLGALGLSTYYQQQGWTFDSFNSRQFNSSIFKRIRDESRMTSKYLDDYFGHSGLIGYYNTRNATNMAVAPNLSSATKSGGFSQGIEPVYANIYMQATQEGDVMRINPVFLKLMRDRNKYDKATIDSVLADNGSVVNQDWVTDEEKDILRTAFEVRQESIIEMASSRQNFIDQGQSVNLYFASDESEEEISRIHKLAFNDKNIKALYYIRSETGIKKGNLNGPVGCAACE
jgi:ribonucleoside-diphosphate reductase alpha chain